MIDDRLLDDVAEYYNGRADKDPTNAPTCRELGYHFDISPSTAHKVRSILWHAGRLSYPPRRRSNGDAA